MTADFERLSRAIGALNTLRPSPLAFGALQVRYLHWGVTPPAYWRSQRHPNPCERHKHSFYEICHAFTGKGHFTTFEPNGHREVGEGDTFYARPGLVHQYGSNLAEPLGICFWSISIEQRRTPSKKSTDAALPFHIVKEGDLIVRGNSRTTAVLSLLFDEALGGGSSERLSPLLRYLTLSFGGATHEKHSELSSSAGPEMKINLGQIGQYLQDHCHRDLKIDEVATRCGFSSRHLARLFKSQFGESFSDSLLRARIQTASHLLLDDSYPLKQIARKSGFNSTSAFVRSFRRFTGVTPGVYRRRSLGAAR